jgi:phage I-like protein
MTDTAQLLERARATVERVRELVEPVSRPLPVGEDLAQLLKRARATVERSRELVEAVRAARMQAASVRVEKAMEREEERFRQIARREIVPFPKG